MCDNEKHDGIEKTNNFDVINPPEINLNKDTFLDLYESQMNNEIEELNIAIEKKTNELNSLNVKFNFHINEYKNKLNEKVYDLYKFDQKKNKDVLINNESYEYEKVVKHRLLIELELLLKEKKKELRNNKLFVKKIEYKNN